MQREKKVINNKIKNEVVEKVCELCKLNKKTIVSLNNALENKMLEVGKKDSTISLLCTDLHKLDSEMKLYEKPKALIKKMALNVDEVNEMIITAKMKELNHKLRALAQTH